MRQTFVVVLLALIQVSPYMSGVRAEDLNRDSLPLFRITLNGRCGYIDVDGNVVIQPRFRDAGMEFDEGMTYASLDTKSYGFIDQRGEWALPPQFPAGGSFHFGRAYTCVDHKAGYIDTTGQFVISPKYDAWEEFRDGVALVGHATVLGQFFLKFESHEGHCDYHYIDRQGVRLGTPGFDAEGLIDPNLLLPVQVGGKYGYVRTDGTWAIEPRFDEAERFQEGLAVVLVGERAGYIDPSGEFAIQPQFGWCRAFHEGLATVYVDNPQTGGSPAGAIDLSGRIVVEPIYYELGPFSGGLAAARVGGERGLVGYVDPSGQMVIEPQFNHAREFRDGLAYVVVDKMVGYINPRGEYVWKPTK